MLNLMRAFNEARLAALHIDIQAGAYHSKFLSSKVSDFAQGLRELDIPNYWVAYTNFGRMSDYKKFMVRMDKDHQIHPDIHIPDNELVFEKASLSAFGSDFGSLMSHEVCILGDHLEIEEIDTLIIDGLLSDMCVASTVRDALKNGHTVYMVLDNTELSNTQHAKYIEDFMIKNKDLTPKQKSNVVFTIATEIESTLKNSQLPKKNSPSIPAFG